MRFGTLFVATGNPGKVREVEPFAAELLTKLGSPGAKLQARASRLKEETGTTFEANAFLKANELVLELLEEGVGNFAVLADDSGLCVDALGGAPGIFSARYAGPGASSAEHVEKLLREMAPHTDRRAHFHCHLTLIVCDAAGTHRSDAEGRCEGTIARELSGHGGFGYDPVFRLPSGETMAEISADEKNRLSHRGRAFAALLAKL